MWRTKGRLPRKYKHIRDDILADGDLVEAELLKQGFPLTAWQQRLLGDYMRQEGIARLAERRLTERGDTMPDADFRGITPILQTATEAGTKVLAKLGLDRTGSGDADDAEHDWERFNAARSIHGARNGHSAIGINHHAQTETEKIAILSETDGIGTDAPAAGTTFGGSS